MIMQCVASMTLLDHAHAKVLYSYREGEKRYKLLAVPQGPLAIELLDHNE